MKYIKLLSALAAISLAFVSCDEDNPDFDKSIFNENVPVRTEFDNWLLRNFTMPYNIEVNYLYNDKLTDHYYNVTPATIENSKALAILIKHVWLEAYVEAVGEDFIRNNTFRVFQFIGSPEYNSQGSIVLGTAEGGVQVTLFRVNELDINDIYIEQDDPYRDHYAKPLDLNYWFFHTMHHEFCHILTQTKNYPTDFQTISAGHYTSGGWINVKDEDAAEDGFVTGYASGEYNEDFAETYANYVTRSEKGWNALLNQAGEEGAATILAKLDIVRTYFMDSWGIDLDALREIVLRRSNEAGFLDLQTLK